jgi:hypothetical protein
VGENGRALAVAPTKEQVVSRRPLVALAVAGAVPALVIASAGTALASPTPGLPKAKAAARQAIDHRLDALAKDLRTIDRSMTLTADHRTTLVGIISNDVTGLRALRGKIDSDTTVAQVQADATHIYTDYRVYALLGPQIGAVVRGDALASQISRILGSISTTTGKNAYRTAQLNHAKTLLNDAQAIVGTAETTALGLTPAQDADGVTPISLVEARSSESAAADDIAAARALIRSVRDSNATS